MPQDEARTLKELAEEGTVFLHDSPEEIEASHGVPKKRVPSDDVMAAAAANAMHAGGMTSYSA